MGFRILCITPWFPNTPREQPGNFILHSVESLVRAENQVMVLVTRPWTPKIFGLFHSDWVRPPLQAARFDPALNIQVAHYPSIPRNYFCEYAGSLYRWGTGKMVRRLVREFAPHLIHVHTELPAYGAVAVGRELRKPVVVTLHGINPTPRLLNTPRKREIVRSTLNGAACIILVGDPLRGHFASLSGRDDHFRIVPNGFFLPGTTVNCGIRKRGSAFRIVSVSNLHEGKGIDLNIGALSLLKKSGYSDWTYAIVGGGRERRALEARVNALDLQDKIVFYGPLQHDQVLDILKEADIFLLPSYREAFGIAYLEAMAAGLLTIGVQGQGPEAFIRNGETGYLVPPRDAEAIFRLLCTIIGYRDDVERIAAAGRKHVMREFTWDRHAERLMGVYAEVTRGTV